jgi:hypothetical protein
MPSDIAGQAAWRDRPDANSRETRTLSSARQEKSQTLGYNLDVMHIFVLPYRRECFEGQGEVFLCAAEENPQEPSTRTVHPLRPSQAILLADSTQTCCASRLEITT